MRAFCSTQKNLRVFVLGTPEGLQISIYDLTKQEWLTNGRMEDALKTAKSKAQDQASLLTGKKISDMKWH